MPSDRGKRVAVRMSKSEVVQVIDDTRTMICVTNGPDGWPHVAPLWFVRSTEREVIQLLAWTYAASQKVRNLERDARATVHVEGGANYGELQGVSLYCHVEFVTERREKLDIARAVSLKYQDGERRPNESTCGRDHAARLSGATLKRLEGQADKRVGLRFVEVARASWDHRKMGTP